MKAALIAEKAARQTTARPPKPRVKEVMTVVLSVIFMISVISSVLIYRLTDEGCYCEDTHVLLYHLVQDDTYGQNDYLFVRVSDFESQLKAIRDKGLHTAFADEPWINGAKPCVVVTFDDGYESVYTNAFPLLVEYGVRATVFVNTDTVGTAGHLTEDQMKTMEESGLVRFGSHTLSHRHLTELDREEARRALSESRTALEKLLDHSVTSLAYPDGAYDDTVLSLVAECGYKYAYTTDAPCGTYYKNDVIPRLYVYRDMPSDEFLKLLP